MGNSGLCFCDPCYIYIMCDVHSVLLIPLFVDSVNIVQCSLRFTGPFYVSPKFSPE